MSGHVCVCMCVKRQSQRTSVNPLQSIRGSEPRGRHSMTAAHISTSAPSSSPPSVPLQLKPFFLWLFHLAFWALWQPLESGTFIQSVTCQCLLSYQTEGGKEKGRRARWGRERGKVETDTLGDDKEHEEQRRWHGVKEYSIWGCIYILHCRRSADASTLSSDLQWMQQKKRKMLRLQSCSQHWGSAVLGLCVLLVVYSEIYRSDTLRYFLWALPSCFKAKLCNFSIHKKYIRVLLIKTSHKINKSSISFQSRWVQLLFSDVLKSLSCRGYQAARCSVTTSSEQDTVPECSIQVSVTLFTALIVLYFGYSYTTSSAFHTFTFPLQKFENIN